MTSSEEELASKKRPRTSISTTQGSNGAKKARGRPRVDTQDATATEVRTLNHSPAVDWFTELFSAPRLYVLGDGGFAVSVNAFIPHSHI